MSESRLLLERPILVYDGDCRFCRKWVDRWKIEAGDRLDIRPYQQVSDPFHGVSRDRFAKAVGFVSVNGRVSFGAEAVYRFRAEVLAKPFWLNCYRQLPGFKAIAEFVYRWVSHHRGMAYRATKLFWGDPASPSTFRTASSLGVRLVGVVFFIAFWSLRDQIVLLVGKGGLLPFQTALEKLHATIGPMAYLHAPTLLWFNGSDQSLRGLCTVGAVAAVFVILDILTLPALIVCYACYLSLFTVGQEFMAYQWDLLLLETGCLAILLALARRRTSNWMNDPVALVAWAFRWLVFRLFFFSGVVKLLSGDLAWRSLTALAYHYQTQPLPTPLAWVAFHLPLRFQKFSTFSVLFVELVVPFLIFAPRRVRHWAAGILILFQLFIALTGNYAFFNLLSIVLCLFLFDDRWFERFMPTRIRLWLTRKQSKRPVTPRFRMVMRIVVGILIAISVIEGVQMFSLNIEKSTWPVMRFVYPFALVNRYGLFAVMTTSRTEIVIEGSDDGTTWKEYQFAYKPGNDLGSGVSFVAPYQPRMDWQMWFAALAPYQKNAWFQPLMQQLLSGKGYARFLFAVNPFPQRPPKFIRAMEYTYRFNPTHENGDWWIRQQRGYYFPPVSLNDLKTL